MVWYRKHLTLLSLLLLPLSIIFRSLVYLRRLLYRSGLWKTEHFSIPVVVVGNLTVGGTGKTPLLIQLVQLLREHGYHPGVVSRGYGGQANQTTMVTTESDVEQSGDEALMIVQKLNCPMVIAVNRPAAVAKLITDTNCNVVLSDDGLQHYALARDIEIVVIDDQRRFGNSLCLPAGPLREPVSRLSQVDFVIANSHLIINQTAFNQQSSDNIRTNEYQMQLITEPFVYHLLSGEKRPISDFKSVHAVAGIGNPQRFFDSLRQFGLYIVEHAFNDHHQFVAQDIMFEDDWPVVMTEKDAIKCRAISAEQHWLLPVSVKLPSQFEQALLRKINDSTNKNIKTI